MTLDPEIKGWCPSAHHPMITGDGLLIRPRIIGASISNKQLYALAHIAEDYGNGLLDLSQRGQFQIRGLTEQSYQYAVQALIDHNLASKNNTPRAPVNIMVSPLSGLTSKRQETAQQLAERIINILDATNEFSNLPPKFNLSINDCQILPLGESDADIAVNIITDQEIELSLAGDDEQIIQTDSGTIVDTILKIMRTYLDYAQRDPFQFRRLGKLLKTLSFDEFYKSAGLLNIKKIKNHTFNPCDYLGRHKHGDNYCIGFSAFSGRWQSRQLLEIANLLTEYALSEIRITPWRALIIPTKDFKAAEKITQSLPTIGVITAREDPRNLIITCPGSPGCLQANGPTHDVALQLTEKLNTVPSGPRPYVHISGCKKGCANPAPSPITVTLQDDHMAIIHNGSAHATPHYCAPSIERAIAYLNHFMTAQNNA